MNNKIIAEDLEYIISANIDWFRFEGKNILITGANGFLPSYMVETLLFLNDNKFNKKLKIYALVRNVEKGFAKFEKYLKRKDFEFIVQDVCEKVLIEEHFDFIIHAASQASPKYYGRDPVGTIVANTIGTKNLLDLALINKCEGFLFFSSGEVYGEVEKENIPIKECSYGYLDPTNVRSCYGEGKRAGETLCVSYYHQFGVPVKIARPFHSYGPGMSLDDGRVHSDFVADIVNNRDIVMKSEGTTLRAFCYVADVITGLFTILIKGKNANAYNVGNENEEISIYNLANILVELFKDKKLKVVKQIENRDSSYIESKVTRNCPDTAKLKKLGWAQKYSLQDGFYRTVRSYL